VHFIDSPLTRSDETLEVSNEGPGVAFALCLAVVGNGLDNDHTAFCSPYCDAVEMLTNVNR
jgi:hypothetical protein